jgi:hypothetical protein
VLRWYCSIQQQDFRLKPRRQRLRVTIGERRRHERPLPCRIGSGTPVIVGKIDDPHRPATLDQHTQRG